MKTLATVTAAALFALANSFGAAHALDYPTDTVTIVVPFAPGGGNDLAGRFFAQRLSDSLGQPVLVENRPGAGSRIGIDYVAKADPDGYTLLWGASDGITMMPAIRADMPYDATEDFAYIARIAELPFSVTVTPNLSVESLEELIAHAKENPGTVRYGSGGVGSAAHMATAMMERAAGIEMVHVPYDGIGPAVTGLITGEIDMLMAAPSSSKPHVDEGTITAIAVTGQERHHLFEDVPTVGEAGWEEMTVVLWYGVLAPAGTPDSVVALLSEQIAAIIEEPETQEWLVGRGLTSGYLDSESFREFVIEDGRLWSRVADEAGIALD